MINVNSSIKLEVTKGSENDLALKSLVYRGSIDGPIGRFSLQQHFHNLASRPLEIVYTFPLNSQMLIDQFKLFLNGQSIRSSVIPLEDAQTKYDNAVLKGDSAVYIQQHRSNIFTLNIGNLAAQDELVIQIDLLQLLSIEGQTIRLMLPTVIGPRYIPGHPLGERNGFGWAEPTDRVPDADWITPPVSVDGVPYVVDYQIDVGQEIAVESVESPSHALRFFPIDNGFKISSQGNVAPDRDFILNLKLKEMPTNRLWKSKFEDKYIFLSWLQTPEMEEPEEMPGDYFFLIDRSGSMAYQKLEMVKRAVRLCLRKLTPGDRLNLAAFNHSFKFWKNDWQMLDNESLALAEKWLANLSADGGTELLPALETFFRMKLDSNRQTVLVLLTDGEVGNEAEISDLFEDVPHNFKVLLFGIDTAVNQELFNGIVEKVAGMVEYIYPGEAMEQKINLQFERLAFPMIRSVKINDQQARLFPANSGLLHPTDLRPVILETESLMEKPSKLTVQLQSGKEYHLDSVTMECDQPMSQALNKFYAHFLVNKELQKLNKFEIWRNPRNQKRLKEKVIKLALKYQLQTEFTAWYAVSEREQKVVGLPEIQIVPSALPDTWNEDVIVYDKPVFEKKAGTRHDMKVTRRSSIRLNKVILPSYADVPDKLYEKILLTQRVDDGAFIPEILEQFSPLRATLFTLLALVNEFSSNPKDALAYRSNFLRALKFVMSHSKKLTMTEKGLLKYVVEQLESCNISLDKKLMQDYEAILADYDDALDEYFEKLQEIMLQGDSEEEWQAFVEKMDNVLETK